MSLEVPAHSNHAGKPASRIRQKNEQAILQAAEDEFARHGYKGTSMNTIAASAGLPKANLHYYFTNKLGLYIAVLSNILELWDSTFNTLTCKRRTSRSAGVTLWMNMETTAIGTSMTIGLYGVAPFRPHTITARCGYL